MLAPDHELSEEELAAQVERYKEYMKKKYEQERIENAKLLEQRKQQNQQNQQTSSSTSSSSSSLSSSSSGSSSSTSTSSENKKKGGKGLRLLGKKNKAGGGGGGGAPPPVYKSTLEEVMSLQADKPELQIPIILQTLCDAVKSLNGFHTEGIFRISGDLEQINQLKEQLNSQNYKITSQDPHAVAGCLKLWVRELAKPLVPEEYYDQCIRSSNRPAELVPIVKQLPQINQRVLDYLIRYLVELCQPEYTAATKMVPENLAIVFAPGILRCSDPAKMMQNAMLEGLFVENLIGVYSKQLADDAGWKL